MYDFPELSEAHETLWRHFVAFARRGGFADALPLTQVCGYPLVTSLRRRFEVIAAPVYDVAFSNGATHCGLIVVREHSSYAALADLRGARFALNGWDSNTGMNLPRRLVAPLAEGGRFFSDIIETGSHLASLEAVRSGAADVASIDNVTFALLAEQRPAAVGGVRVLTRTASSPTPPFVVPVGSVRGVGELLYDSLGAAIDELVLAGWRNPLHLAGVERASVTRYEPLLRLENEATDIGYGTLA